MCGQTSDAFAISRHDTKLNSKTFYKYHYRVTGTGGHTVQYLDYEQVVDTFPSPDLRVYSP